MTTTSASPSNSHNPWLDVDHWKPGDDAVVVFFSGVDETEELVTIASAADQSLIEGRNTDAPTIWIDTYARVRHVHSCAPCLAWLNGARLYGNVMGGYWSQWSSAARLTHNALRKEIEWDLVDRHLAGTFTKDADVPDWLREATAGHLLPPESPSLSVARIWDPINWPTLLEKHPGELPVLVEPGWVQPHITWNLIVDVYRMIETASLDLSVAGFVVYPTAAIVQVCMPPAIQDIFICSTVANDGGYRPLEFGSGRSRSWGVAPTTLSACRRVVSDPRSSASTPCLSKV